MVINLVNLVEEAIMCAFERADYGLFVYSLGAVLWGFPVRTLGSGDLLTHHRFIRRSRSSMTTVRTAVDTHSTAEVAVPTALLELSLPFARKERIVRSFVKNPRCASCLHHFA